MSIQKIRPCLWFDGNAEEAVALYLSVFPRSKLLQVSHTNDGKALTVSFELEGQQYLALNGGPHYHFTEAISLSVDCADQDEVDALWQKLTADGGEPGRCGWLKDKFGLSWQIVPSQLSELIVGPDPQGAARAMQAMLTMSKLDIGAMKRAYEGR